MTRMNSVTASRAWLGNLKRRAGVHRGRALRGLTLAIAPTAYADDAASSSAADANIAANPTLQTAPSSNFASQKVDGQPFFLLSDASFGSDQLAQVRLEAPGREFKDALQAYGGADIVVYRVPKPLDFLKAQKNLHRLNVAPNYQGEGLANTLAYLWDRWFTEARRAWQRVLSFATRSKATEAAAAIQARRADRQADAIPAELAVRAAEGLRHGRALPLSDLGREGDRAAEGRQSRRQQQ